MRLLKRLSIAALAACAALVGVGAYGWFVAPGVLVGPLRQVGYWNFGIASRTLEVNGHAWPYLECGNSAAPPVIFLHGFGTSKDAMMRMMPVIAAEGYRAIAPDLPGFGDHPRHAGEHQDAAFYTREIGAFMDAVGAPSAVVVGTSMGGALAAELAIQSPERTRAIALLSPAGVEPPVRNAFMRAVDAGELPLDIRDAADFDRIMTLVFLHPPAVPAPFRAWFVEKAVERRADTLEIIGALRGFLADGLRGRMGAIRVPVLVLYGSEDAVTDPSMLHVFAAELPDATAVVVPEAGHVAFSDNWPGVWRELRAWLKRSR